MLLQFHDESVKFMMASWFCSNSILAHLFYGTVVFSSSLLLGSVDTSMVIPRYWLSAVLCRIILMFEISGMRLTTEVELEDQGKFHSRTNSLPSLKTKALLEHHCVGTHL